MFDKLKDFIFHYRLLTDSEIDEFGALRCHNNKYLVAFMYVLDGKEFIYVFNEYKKYRNEIEKIFAEKRNNATHLHVADETDLGYDIRSGEESVCSVRETTGGLPESSDSEHI